MEHRINKKKSKCLQSVFGSQPLVRRLVSLTVRPSSDTAIKFKFSLKRSVLSKVETGFVEIVTDAHWNAFGLILLS